ncbi:MAG: fibronectin type III domain-containing protein, partial [Candidatus Aminicenantes bacterium]|nr:fibronectin type III domain-containing protein [Candidatus Aminicenantes bacterium]
NLERVVNNLIFVNEYVNRITWMENPENQVELLSYRVYGKVKGNGDDTYELIAELDPTVMGYDDRGLEEDQYFTYKITAVSFRGKESDPVIVSN